MLLRYSILISFSASHQRTSIYNDTGACLNCGLSSPVNLNIFWFKAVTPGGTTRFRGAEQPLWRPDHQTSTPWCEQYPHQQESLSVREKLEPRLHTIRQGPVGRDTRLEVHGRSKPKAFLPGRECRYNPPFSRSGSHHFAPYTPQNWLWLKRMQWRRPTDARAAAGRPKYAQSELAEEASEEGQLPGCFTWEFEAKPNAKLLQVQLNRPVSEQHLTNISWSLNRTTWSLTSPLDQWFPAVIPWSAAQMCIKPAEPHNSLTHCKH